MFVRTLRGLVAATLLVAAVSTAVEAQQADASRFGVNAGIALPMGDFGDFAELGLHAGAHWQMPLGTTLQLRINGDFGRYSVTSGSDAVTMFGGIANIIYPIQTASAFDPYVLGGLGFYSVDVGPASESKVAFNVGAGYDFKMGNKNLFTEIKFVSIQTDGTSLTTLPITLGLRF